MKYVPVIAIILILASALAIIATIVGMLR